MFTDSFAPRLRLGSSTARICWRQDHDSTIHHTDFEVSICLPCTGMHVSRIPDRFPITGRQPVAAAPSSGCATCSALPCLASGRFLWPVCRNLRRNTTLVPAWAWAADCPLISAASTVKCVSGPVVCQLCTVFSSWPALGLGLSAFCLAIRPSATSCVCLCETQDNPTAFRPGCCLLCC